MNAAAPHEGVFSYTPAQFEALVDMALAHAAKLGASDAAASVNESVGLSVGVRCGEPETAEHHRGKSLDVTVYLGQRSGSADTSDFSPAAVQRTVQAAWDIARFTAEDPAAGLPDAALVWRADAEGAVQPQALDLFHPWTIGSAEALALAQRAEQAAFAVHARITNSEGASVWTGQQHFFSAHTHGLRGGFASSSHGLSVVPIAKDDSGAMQRDWWTSTARCAAELATPEDVGRVAARRALRRLGAQPLATRQCPVLFEAPLALGLLSCVLSAISGGALHRRMSFLQDSLGEEALAAHLDIASDPLVPRAFGSAPFDSEGIQLAPRRLVDAGRVQGYVLGSYSARKLGMQATGATGCVRLTSRHTQPGDTFDAMLGRMGSGLLVTELIGDGVNMVTGDYSRGASGFWVQGGRIAYPVEGVTIAGNLREMLRGVQAVGADEYTRGAFTSGSVLIERMTVAGEG